MDDERGSAEERRRHPRSRCSVEYMLLLRGKPICRVILKDISMSGARFLSLRGLWVPGEFEVVDLKAPNSPARRVRRVWHRGDEFGGEFLSSDGPPPEEV